MKKIITLLLACHVFAMAQAQQTTNITIEKPESYGAIPNNYIAEFRLRTPGGDGKIQYVIVLVPGFNIDGREWADAPEWQAFADEHQCAILACHFAVPSETGPHYNIVENWSGKALLDILKQYSVKTGRDELDTAPLLFWGHSAGSVFSYNMANWSHARVAGFVSGKSMYNTDVPKEAMLGIPGLFILGEKDKERFDIITHRYNSGRRSGALWCYAIEPGVGHNIAKSPSLGRAFLKAVIARRETMAAGGADASWLGDIRDYSIRAKPDRPVDVQIYTWLPDEAFAKTWRWVVSAGKASDNRHLRFYNR